MIWLHASSCHMSSREEKADVKGHTSLGALRSEGWSESCSSSPWTMCNKPRSRHYNSRPLQTILLSSCSNISHSPYNQPWPTEEMTAGPRGHHGSSRAIRDVWMLKGSSKSSLTLRIALWRLRAWTSNEHHVLHAMSPTIRF